MARRFALVVVAGLALAGCGSSMHTSTTGSTAAAQAQIKSAYEKFFSGRTSISDRVALLQNGSTFEGVIRGFASLPLAKNVSATVNVSVVGEDGTTAADIKARAEGSAPAKAKAEDAAPTTDETDESDGSDEYSVEEAGEKADEE